MMRSVSARALFAFGLCVLVAGCGSSSVTLQPVTPHPSPVGSTPTPAATASSTASAVASPTPAASPTATVKPSATPTATPTATAAPSPTPTASSSVLAMWGIVAGTVFEFGSGQIASGTVTPYHQFSIQDPNFTGYMSMAFDRSGNMWIGESNLTINASGNYSGQIVEFTAAQLAALTTKPNPAPHAILTVPGGVFGLAFDASGSLWASVFTFSSPQALKYTAAQIAAGSGSPAPSITLTVQVTGAIAFASDGTLWMTPTTVFGPSAGIVYGLAPSQLTASSAQAPQYTLQPSGPPIVIAGQEAVVVTPNQLGFDAGGNLWSIFNGFTFEFAASALHSSNAPTMASFQGYTAQSAGGSSTIYNGYALSFDPTFDLIENSSTDSLHEYTPTQYAGGGAAFTSATLASNSPYTGGAIGNFVIAGPYVP